MFAGMEDGIGFVEVDDDGTFFEAADDTGNEFAFAIFVLVVNDILFGFAHTLEDDLFSGLSGNTSEAHFGAFEVEQGAIIFVLFFSAIGIFGAIKDLNEEFIAQADVCEAVIVCIFEGDIAEFVFNFFRDLEDLEQFNFIKLFIVIGFDFALLTKYTFGCGSQGNFEGFDQYRLIHAFFTAYLSNYFTKLKIHEYISLVLMRTIFRNTI